MWGTELLGCLALQEDGFRSLARLLPNFRPVVCIQIVTSRHGVSWHVMRHVRYMFSGAGAARAVAPGGADTTWATWAGTWFDGLGSVVIEEDGDTLIASEVRRFGGRAAAAAACRGAGCRFGGCRFGAAAHHQTRFVVHNDSAGGTTAAVVARAASSER